MLILEHKERNKKKKVFRYIKLIKDKDLCIIKLKGGYI